MKKIIAFVAVVALSGGIAVAAQQGAAAKKLFVKVVNMQGFSTRVIYLSKNTTGTVAGDPVADGASFNVGFPGGDTECISLPSSNWKAIRGGFRFRDPGGGSAARVATIKRSQTGTFRLKLVATHAGIEPPGPATAYFTNFKINAGGDEYCASTGSAIPTKNDEKTFLVKNDDGTACALSACSSPSGAFLDASPVF